MPFAKWRKFQVGIGKLRAGFVGLITAIYTQVGTVGTGEDTLMTTSLLANSLYKNGMALRVTMWGSTANNGNAKALKIYFGSQIVATIATLTVSQVNTWRAVFDVIRVTATTQVISGKLFQDGTAEQEVTTNTAGTQNLAAAVVIKATGEATTTDDIIQVGMLVEVLS